MRRGSRRLVRAAKRRGRALRRRARPSALAAYYRVQRSLPLQHDLAVFAAYWGRGYACNPRAIHEAAQRTCPTLQTVWVVGRRHAKSFPPDVPHVVAGTRSYYRALARATYFVNNVNFPDHLVKRPGTVHLMTHHGTPLKTMGVDLKDVGGRTTATDFDALLRRVARWDYSLSSNEFSTQVWERAFPGSYTSLEVGYPRNDRLAGATAESVRDARRSLGVGDHQTVVLYAPTHREYDRSFIMSLDLAAFAEGLRGGDADYVVLVRVHHFSTAAPRLGRLTDEGLLRDVSSHPSIEQLSLAADVLLTDYSSVMFDYAVLDRPIAVYAPDWETYVERRGTYFDLLAEPPGFVARTTAELVEGFRTGAVSSQAAATQRAAFRARFCTLDDGHAAERVVQQLFAPFVTTPTSTTPRQRCA